MRAGKAGKHCGETMWAKDGDGKVTDGEGKNGLALALGGGGSRGAFEIGAWEAFRELGLSFDAVAGTSIGSINGALFAMDAFDEARAMWENLQMDQCLAFSKPYPLKSEDLLHLNNMRALAQELVSRHRLDTQPLRSLLGGIIREDRVRNARIRFGLMTVLFRSLKPQSRWIDEIPANRLIDYIMASAGLPGLDPVQIGGERFLDGGFAESVPISMLRAEGYHRIVAVDLSHRSTVRGPGIDNLQLTLIHDPDDLGGMFDLTPAVLARNHRLGYLDTRKAFGRLAGERYSLEPGEWRKLAVKYGVDLVPGLEQAASAYGIDRLPVYTAEAFEDALRARRAEAQAEYAARRGALRVEQKSEAFWAGKLHSLRMLPPMQLSFLLELAAQARKRKSPIQAPVSLFRQMDRAVDALMKLDEGNP